ncbi:MAG: hypothetical protein WCT49_01560 [Candidatus Paceibacterota bacterium]|jgi:hypothetical protein
MRKILVVLVLVVVWLGFVEYAHSEGIRAAQLKPETHNGIISTVKIHINGLGLDGYYVKDTNAVPPLCYFQGSGGGEMTLVPCENLKYYFGDK